MFNKREYQVLSGIVLSVLSLFFGLYGFFVKPPVVLIRNSGAQDWELRMKPVKQALPAEVNKLGYVSDLDLLVDPSQQQLFTELDEFPLTMYSMTPRLVQRGLNYEWVIGNFTNPNFQEFLDERLPSGYELKSMGFGIYLIHIKKP